VNGMATSACPIQVARQGVRVFSSLESAIVATDSFFGSTSAGRSACWPARRSVPPKQVQSMS
jgi:hypothetical protein